MQFLPSTWASCCTGDITDDHDAIMGAATYLARSGAPARIDDAVFFLIATLSSIPSLLLLIALVMALGPRLHVHHPAPDLRLPPAAARADPARRRAARHRAPVLPDCS